MKFSIITVTYNSGKTLVDTIESILNQTFKDYEYIIVDGNSSDNTVEIIKSYESKFDGKLKWVSEPDNGIYDAFNKGVKMSSGEIIGIINSDDWFENNTLEIVNDISKNVDSNLSIITGKICKYSGNKKLYYMLKDPSYLDKVIYQMPVNHTSTFVYKDVYNKLGLFDTTYKIAADYDFIYKTINSNVNYYHTEENLSNMRIGGVSSNIKTAKLIVKERLRIRKINSGKVILPFILYFKESSILVLRVIKRKFIKSKYDY